MPQPIPAQHAEGASVAVLPDGSAILIFSGTHVSLDGDSKVGVVSAPLGAYRLDKRTAEDFAAKFGNAVRGRK